VESGDSNDQYFADSSNFLDILMVITLPVSFFMQRANQALGGDEDVALCAAWMLSIGLMVAWLNLLKFLRAFESFGPLYVMLMKMGKDISNFLILYVTVSIPFAVIFRMFFGRSASAESDFKSFGRSWYNTFAMTVGTYDPTAMAESAYFTGVILWLLWFFMSGVVLLNLFIAMMGATFGDAYDERDGIWALERANIISRAEENMSTWLYEHHCAPPIHEEHAHGGLTREEKARFKRESTMKSHAKLNSAYAPPTSHSMYVRFWFWVLPNYKRLNDMSAAFAHPRLSAAEPKLSEYLESAYDDPDEEAEISNASVRAKMLAAISRVEAQQDKLQAKVSNMDQFMKQQETARRSRTRGGGGGGGGGRGGPLLPPLGGGVRQSARGAPHGTRIIPQGPGGRSGGPGRGGAGRGPSQTFSSA
jgi:hypothetical protein